MHHLRRYLSDPNTIVLVIGYQAYGTLGRRIYEGAKEVHIYGKPVEVRAKVIGIGSFSAHGDRDKLTRWLQPEDGVMPLQVFLTHGDPEVKEEFAAHLQQTLGTQIVLPEQGVTYEI